MSQSVSQSGSGSQCVSQSVSVSQSVGQSESVSQWSQIGRSVSVSLNGSVSASQSRSGSGGQSGSVSPSGSVSRSGSVKREGRKKNRRRQVFFLISLSLLFFTALGIFPQLLTAGFLWFLDLWLLLWVAARGHSVKNGLCNRSLKVARDPGPGSTRIDAQLCVLLSCGKPEELSKKR